MRKLKKISKALELRWKEAWDTFSLLVPVAEEDLPEGFPRTTEEARKLRERSREELARLGRLPGEVQAFSRLSDLVAVLDWERAVGPLFPAEEVELDKWPEKLPLPPENVDLKALEAELRAWKPQTAVGEHLRAEALASCWLAQAVQRYHRGEKPSRQPRVVWVYELDDPGAN